MNDWCIRPARFVAIGAALFSFAGLLTGCVSTKYKKAPKDTPPPLALNLATVQPPVAVTLQTVIVFKGPGSWKKEAYWDEYVVAITNQGTTPVTFESAALYDALGNVQSFGRNPWELEKLSRENLQKYQHYGRKIMIGAGLTAGWFTSVGLGYAATWVGNTALATTAAAVIVVIPVWALSTGVRYMVARSAITDEFNRRRIAGPLVLKPGETRQGSLFFPISPGPQRLALRCWANDSAQVVTLDLAPLAGLHFLKELAAGMPAVAAKP